MPKTILLVDDHPIFRQGLRQILEKEKDLKVVGEAGNGLEAVDRFRDLLPDIVVMDINMPNFDGTQATRQILSEYSDTKVVALSVHSGKQFVRDMIQAGASGYILKESIPEEMIEGIRTVLSGNLYLSESISNILISDYKTLISKSEPGPDELPTSILHTKLRTPPISNHILPRIRLIELLENGVENPVSLIAAPAGYGKSTLASQWLEVSEVSGAWISLDESDNDTRIFLSYIIQSIQNLFPQQELKSRSILGAAELPSVSRISRYLLNDLEPLSERFILVLDDFHLIHNNTIHQLMGELLGHPSPKWHLALLTRRDPALPLTALRGRGMLTEITTSHLRFTASETKEFLERFLRIALADKTALIIEEKIEGWVTGLHLAALSIRGEADQDRLTAGLTETSQFVQDYLFQEVISHVPQQMYRHLLQTAILDRFCAPLCHALSAVDLDVNQTEADADGAEFIDWLNKTKLFVIPLDAKNQWFRYHHLFRDILQGQLKQRCSSEEIAELHLKACKWFDGHGWIDEAIHHALAAGDTICAAEIIEGHRHDEIIQDQWHTIGRWLDLLPPEIVKKRPRLLLSKAWRRFNQFRLLEIPPLLELASELLADEPVQESLLGELDFHRGYLSIWIEGDGKLALKRLEHARNRIPETYREIAAEIEFDIALANYMIGEGKSVLKSLEEKIRTTISPDNMIMTRWLGAQIFIYLMAGDLRHAIPAARKMRSVAKEGGNTEIVAWSDYLLAIAQFQTYRLEEALQSFRLAAEHREIMHRKAAVEAMVGLVLTYQTMQRTDEAADAMKDLLEFARWTADQENVSVAESCRIRLSLLRGDLKSADHWVQPFDAEPHAPSALFWLEVPLITQARMRIAAGAREGLERALESIRELRQQGEKLHFTCLTIEIAALQSVALEKLGRTDEALKTLKEVIALAQPGGWIRPFVEAGPPMTDLLKRMQKQDVAVDYINRILASFPDATSTPLVPDLRSTNNALRPEPESVNQKESSTQTADKNPIRQTNGGQESNPPNERRTRIQNPLVEPLSIRELDVLELLAKRLQSKEIADKLSISTATVKSHLKNIYQKLNATNRREAVEKAKDLGIL